MFDFMDWQKNDYYTMLEVTQMATATEIHKAYRKKAKIYHPDRHALNSEERKTAEKKFKELQIAHETLIDPVKRANYDEQLLIMQQAYRDAIIYDVPIPTPKDENKEDDNKDNKKRKKELNTKKSAKQSGFNENLKKAYEEVASMRLKEREDGSYYYVDEPEEDFNEEVPVRRGISEASKKSAANAYFLQGMRYASTGDHHRAISAFNNALKLDPTKRIPTYIWAYGGKRHY